MRYEKTNFTNKYGNTTTHQSKCVNPKVHEFYDLSIYIKYEISICLKSNVLNKKDNPIGPNNIVCLFTAFSK